MTIVTASPRLLQFAADSLSETGLKNEVYDFLQDRGINPRTTTIENRGRVHTIEIQKQSVAGLPIQAFTIDNTHVLEIYRDGRRVDFNAYTIKNDDAKVRIQRRRSKINVVSIELSIDYPLHPKQGEVLNSFYAETQLALSAIDIFNTIIQATHDVTF